MGGGDHLKNKSNYINAIYQIKLKHYSENKILALNTYINNQEKIKINQSSTVG